MAYPSHDYPTVSPEFYDFGEGKRKKIVQNCGNCKYEIGDIVRLEAIMANLHNKKYEDHHCKLLKDGKECNYKRKPGR